MQHSDKNIRPENPKGQSMKIAPAEGSHEREADAFALKHNGDQLTAPENSQDFAWSGAEIDSGMIAPPQMQERINGTRGAGDKLPANIRSKTKEKAAELDKIHIHTDSTAADLAGSVNAKAFTSGSDIYFSQGAFEPYSKDGQDLILHEVAHALQHSKTGERSLIQCRFNPEDASAEMVGKKFTLDREVTENFNPAGKVTFPVGQVVTIKTWDNKQHAVSVTAYHAGKKKSFGFSVEKHWLTPVGDTVSGLDQYHSGVSQTKESIATGQQKIDAWKLKEDEYKKANNMAGYNAELTRLQGLQDNRYKTFNSQMIQETMFNAMDASIKKWTAHYNKTIGKPAGWTDLDPNLVKAMVWKESQMGTSGDFLPTGPTHPDARMTRFNVMQAIDSSGPQQIIMMDENDLSSPSLEDRFHYRQVPKDLDEAKKLNLQKSRNSAEDAKVKVLKDRCYQTATGEWRYNDYFTKDPRWQNATSAFFKQTNPPRNMTYDFWIQTGVRWLFEKRESVSSWDAAITAYNGSGPDAVAYKNKVKSIAKDAKTATQNKTEFIPK